MTDTKKRSEFENNPFKGTTVCNELFENGKCKMSLLFIALGGKSAVHGAFTGRKKMNMLKRSEDTVLCVLQCTFWRIIIKFTELFCVNLLTSDCTV